MNLIIYELCLLFFLAYSYLDHNKILYAIDCGSPYYYKDKTKILFRYDQEFVGGLNNQYALKPYTQSNYLIPTMYLDFRIFQTERTVLDNTNFTYHLTIRQPGNYTLLLYFIENDHKYNERRLFNIFLNDQVVVE